MNQLFGLQHKNRVGSAVHYYVQKIVNPLSCPHTACLTSSICSTLRSLC